VIIENVPKIPIINKLFKHARQVFWATGNKELGVIGLNDKQKAENAQNAALNGK